MLTVPHARELYSSFRIPQAIDGAILDSLFIRARPYVILFQPRSGSTLLTELMGLSRLGWPHEWANPLFQRSREPQFGCSNAQQLGCDTINAFIQAVARLYMGRDNLLGIQLSFAQSRAFSALIRPKMKVPLKKVKFIYLRRKDIIGQAVSLTRAAASRYYHSFEGDVKRLRSSALELTNKDILQSLADLIAAEQEMEAMIKRIDATPLRLFYEDFSDDPRPVIEKIAGYLGITSGDTPRALSTLTVLRDAKSLNWRMRLLEESAHEVDQMLCWRPT